MFKLIFAAAISGMLLCAFPPDQARAQTTAQQDGKDKKASAADARAKKKEAAAKAREEKAAAKTARAKEKTAAKEAKAKERAAAKEAKAKAAQERTAKRAARIKAAEDRSVANKKSATARIEKMRGCAAKWQEHKKTASDKSRKAYNAFMKPCLGG